MERVGHIPLKVVDGFWDQDLFLYVMKKHNYPGSQGSGLGFEREQYPIGVNALDIAMILGAGWHGLEPAIVWSSGNAQLVLDSDMFSDKRLPAAIVLEISPFAASHDRRVGLRMAACGDQHQFNFNSSARSELRIAIPAAGTRGECMIGLHIENATSPSALGLSSDLRVLGVALHSVTFE